MKVKRSQRLIDMTRYLMEHPHTLIPLPFFVHRYESAKSSISEDITILKRTFSENGMGTLKTIPGAAGGSIFIPSIQYDEASGFINKMKTELNDSSRYISGGYLYMTDILSHPSVVRNVGRIIISQYVNQKIDYVMTMATGGISIAEMVASYLNVPFVVARHESKITDGSTINVNYISGSSDRINRMVLSKRSLPPKSNVLIVDDYMKGGGTISGLAALIKEFDCHLAGVSVFAEDNYNGKRAFDFDYTSLIKVNIDQKHINVSDGNYVQNIFNQ
ncbi:pur operon repressor [Philodulcilactobacillus myokoensis]|uniref:Pur operon repressor n=1 Tax=Philodulcilactobacillus myokoensis TaxID=2929573 RepID=A0A9W6ETF7_9LACO|nr:pur operon repressor [Philodulcilactobacillus myokoensis]GLB47228.1 pur operon repressor [Philodulcilactobacillus myokoensis]